MKDTFVPSGAMKKGSRPLRRALFGGGAIVFLVFFCWAYGSSPINMRERIFPKNLAEVKSGWLYRSGQIRPNLIEGTLRDLNIDVIVDLTEDLGPRDASQMAEKRAAAELGIEVRRFPLNGSGIGAIDRYVGAIAEVARAERDGRRVLVHCRAGDRRTGGVIAAYQILVKGESVETVRAELDRFSGWSTGETRLKRFLAEHLDEIAQGLLDAGVIARLPDPMPTFASL